MGRETLQRLSGFVHNMRIVPEFDLDQHRAAPKLKHRINLCPGVEASVVNRLIGISP